MNTFNIDKFASLNQTQAHGNTSDRYAFIPTKRVLDVLGDHGWLPVSVQETRARSENRGFQKHLIRLAQQGSNQGLLTVGEERAEIVLVNSHNGTSAFNLMLGIYRCVCANQAVVGSSQQSHHVRHSGYADELVENAIRGITNSAEIILPRLEVLKSIPLSLPEQTIYAESALELIKDKEEKFSLDPKALLQPRRYADQENDLWSTFNRVQENIMKGGIRRYDANNRRTRTRAIRNIDKNIAVNRALWDLTEKMAELKSANN